MRNSHRSIQRRDSTLSKKSDKASCAPKGSGVWHRQRSRGIDELSCAILHLDTYADAEDFLNE